MTSANGPAHRLMKVFWRRPAGDLPERTRRRVVVHLIPYLFFLYILAYLDRINISVAALRMSLPPAAGGLGFTNEVIGFGGGIFFWGYWLLEIPSTLSVLRWGARWVFVRILILWGLACMLIGVIGMPIGDQMFGWVAAPIMDPFFAAVGAAARWLNDHVVPMDAGPLDNPAVRQFYFLRFMLGFFEGGFFPSVILYLSLWFRGPDRAKAVASFMAAIPISVILGAPLSGLMLHISWFGLEGWRWIFLLQGIAPVLAGFATLFFLPDRPQSAAWLEPDERDWLVNELEREQAGRKVQGHWAWIGQSGIVLLLTSYYFCANVTGYGLSLFMPKIIKQQSGLSDTWAAVVAASPYVMSLFGMLFNGWHSDRKQERIGHVVAPMIALGASIYLAARLDGLWIWPVLVMIFLVGPFMHAPVPAFWPIPTAFLGAAAAASAIGFINMLGNLGGFVGPAMVGRASEGQMSFAPALLRLAPFPLAAAAIILIVGLTGKAASGGKKA